MKEQNATLSLLQRLKVEIPEVWEQAQVVGKWVWLEFNVAPIGAIRANLKKLGFHLERQAQMLATPMRCFPSACRRRSPFILSSQTGPRHGRK